MLTRLCATLLVVLTVLPFTPPLISCGIDDLLATSTTRFERGSVPLPAGPSVTTIALIYALPSVSESTGGRNLFKACTVVLSLRATLEPPVPAPARLATGPEVPSQDTKFVLRI